jgi:group I intron endonuclease
MNLFNFPGREAERRQAHNSSWQDGIEYQGLQYVGPNAIHRTSKHPDRVSINTFTARLARRRKAGEKITSAVVHECLTTSPKAYQAKYGSRKTYLVVAREKCDVAELYEEFVASQVTYSTFRTRLVSLAKRMELSREHVLQAATYGQDVWVSFHGGGKGRRSVTYEGDEYPEHDGKTFSSLSSFMRSIDRYKDRNIVSRRTRSGWSIEDALINPVLPKDDRTGCIYMITQLSTGMRYIGLTTSPIRVRLDQHFNAAYGRETTRPLLKAMRKHGRDDFSIEVIEDNVPSDDLPKREVAHIAERDTMIPNGFNANKGGARSSSTSTAYDYGDRKFRSKAHAVAVLSEETGHTPNVVDRRLSDSKPLADKARRKHHHPQAGTKMHRRWRSLIRCTQNGTRPGTVVPEWSNWDKGYDQFLQDVMPTHVEGHEIVIVDTSKPWGPDNFMWIPRGNKTSLRMGKSITIGDRTFSSLSEAAEACNIGKSTLKYRLSRGMDPLEAATKPLGPTSRKRPNRQATVVNGKRFESVHAAAIYGANAYGITYHMAKDRLARGLPMDHNAQACKPIEIDGQQFESISAAVRHYGIPQVRFASRRGKGWTIREALELDPRQKRSQLT